MNLKPEFQALVDAWKNTDEVNNYVHAMLTEIVNGSGLLRPHRDWVEANQFGFGDRAFHAVWELLVHEMPDEFSFLEVGVFKGQVLSLVALLAKVMEKKAHIVGVTTLENTPDERCRYPEGDYRKWIAEIHDHFEVPQPRLVVGKSNDQHVLREIGGMEFEIAYVDGNHDYPIVLQDLDNYSKRVKVGGFLVVDDASITRLNVGSCWPGLEMVAAAVREYLDPHPSFRFLFCCGHVNVFEKIKPQIG